MHCHRYVTKADPKLIISKLRAIDLVYKTRRHESVYFIRITSQILRKHLMSNNYFRFSGSNCHGSKESQLSKYRWRMLQPFVTITFFFFPSQKNIFHGIQCCEWSYLPWKFKYFLQSAFRKVYIEAIYFLN